MAVTRKQLYDVALNSQGFILAERPEKPRITCEQDAVFGNRFAQGDRDYNDFAKWWYMAQTDWSGGRKDTISWEDDAKFYYSTNIDARLKPGSLQFERQLRLVRDDGDEVLDVKTLFYGPGSSVTAYISSDAVKKLSTGTNLFTSGASTSPNFIHSHRGYIWTFGGTVSGTVTADNTIGGAATSKASLINAVINGSMDEANCAVSIGDVLYIFGINTNEEIFCVKTTVANPTASSDFTVVFQVPVRDNLGPSVAGAKQLGSEIIFLVEGSPIWSLYSLDISSGATTLLKEFTNCDQLGIYDAGARYVQEFGLNELLITIINDNDTGKGSVWKYDGSNLTKLYGPDEKKQSYVGTSYEPVGFLRGGCVVFDDYAYWGNLVYDGTNLFNFIKDINDSVTNVGIPVGSDGTLVYLVDLTVVSGDDQTIIYSYSPTDTLFKDEGHLVFSQFDRVSAIDKLAYSVTILFEPLDTGEKITVEYTTQELSPSTSWTTLGNVNAADDGTTIIEKKFYFGDAVLFNKVWFRIKYEGDGTSTPDLKDFILEYLPMPDYKLRWQFTAKCIDEIQLKDGTKETKSGLWLRNMLRQSWITKSILSFEDYDASAAEQVSGSLSSTATTITVANTTDNFPERGRVLIESEEIIYNGKNKNQLLNCTRGARGTIAAAHSNGTTISTAYRILIRNYREDLIIANRPTQAEYLVTLDIAEV